MNLIFRVVLWIVISILVTASLFPLFGYELIISANRNKEGLRSPRRIWLSVCGSVILFCNPSLLWCELSEAQTPPIFS